MSQKIAKNRKKLRHVAKKILHVVNRILHVAKICDMSQKNATCRKKILHVAKNRNKSQEISVRRSEALGFISLYADRHGQ